MQPLIHFKKQSWSYHHDNEVLALILFLKSADTDPLVMLHANP